MKALRRFVPALWLALALALVAGQMAAQLHDLSHAVASVQSGSQDQHPGSDTCDKCSLYAPFSGAAASFGLVLAAVAAAIVAALARSLPALSRTVVTSRSRAPPASA
jgi:hypothetical protein